MNSSLLPEPFYHALRSAEGKVFVTADPFFAKALKAETNYPDITDIFTWASEKVKQAKPNPLDLLVAFDEALATIGLSGESYFPEHWAMAQHLGRDWQEVLWATSSLTEALHYWHALEQEKEIQRLFALYKEKNDPWLTNLNIPLKNAQDNYKFWKSFSKFICIYHEKLEKRGLLFAEEALQAIVSNKSFDWSNVVFLHLYSSYPIVEKAILQGAKAGAQVWRWDTDSLSEILPEVWDTPFPHTEIAPWPDRKRNVTIYERSFRIELLEEAAEKIIEWHKNNPNARIAVWSSEELFPLIRHLLESKLDSKEVLSPQAPTLWESTQVGQELQQYLLEGLAGRIPAWPKVCKKSASPTEDSADQWAAKLYDQVRPKMRADDPRAWEFLFQLLQSPNPTHEGVSPQTRIYLARLPQIAGGAYDALFLIDPPREFLGRWERVSFWTAGLRRRFFSPEAHQKLGWRLVSLLLWGSKTIFLWRLAGAENRTPIEDLLTHAESLGLSKYFQICPLPSHSPAQLPTPSPASPPIPFPTPITLSPSEVGQLFTCPRKFYWQKTLPPRPSSEPAEIGTLLHESVGWAFRPRRPSIQPYEASLRQVAYRLSRRRLYYRLARIQDHEGKRPWKQKYKPLRPFLAQAGQPVLHSLIRILDQSYQYPQQILRFCYFTQRRDKLRFFSEEKIQLLGAVISSPCCLTPTTTGGKTHISSGISLTGRIDLLITALTDKTGKELPIPPTYLIDFKSSLAKNINKPDNIPWDWQWPDESNPYAPPRSFPEPLLQVLLYAYALVKSGKISSDSPLTIAILNLWWRPKQSIDTSAHNSEKNEDTPCVSLSAKEIEHYNDKLAKLIQAILKGLSKVSTASINSFLQTNDRKICKYCDFALLCDRLEVQMS